MQAEIMYTPSHRSSLRRRPVFRVINAALYLVIFVNAAYWTVFGNWIDGWDASLWLVAFLLLDFDLFKVSNEPDDPIDLKLPS
jgi:hypothetical protein